GPDGLEELGEPLVKIVDFGLALLTTPDAADDSSGPLTRHGMFIGTPDFAAPEQALDPHRADGRSDLYSLGCTFYFLLTGEVPFPGGTPFNKLYRHGTEEATPPEQLHADIPPAVGAIVRRLMAKDPAERYQAAGELAAELDLLKCALANMPSV